MTAALCLVDCRRFICVCMLPICKGFIFCIMRDAFWQLTIEVLKLAVGIKHVQTNTVVAYIFAEVQKKQGVLLYHSVTAADFMFAHTTTWALYAPLYSLDDFMYQLMCSGATCTQYWRVCFLWLVINVLESSSDEHMYLIHVAGFEKHLVLSLIVLGSDQVKLDLGR
jgi:hypothetical protein